MTPGQESGPVPSIRSGHGRAGDTGVAGPLAIGAKGGTDRKSESTHERLVEAARRLFLENGYRATGVAEILREAGVNSGSLYHFFKTKEELLLAVLDKYVELLHPCVIDPVVSGVDDPIDRVFAILAGYREMLVATGCRQGCPIGNIALEMSDKSESVRLKVALNMWNWRKAIRTLLEADRCPLPAGVDRDRLATFILTVMEGAVMQARVQHRLEPFDVSVSMLRDYFDRMINTL